MTNIYGILNTGRTALLAQRKGVDVAGHNISNVNTPGFSRQRVNLETNTPTSLSPPGQLGTGVRTAEIQRIYDRFLGDQINRETTDMERWDSQKNALERVEMIFNESSEYGLSSAMSEFWNSWHDLANNPEDQPQRTVVVEKAESLTNRFQKIYRDLMQVQDGLDRNIEANVQDINLMSEQVAHLNMKIFSIENLGDNANDYRDKRDLIIKEISSIIDITSFEDPDGKMTVLAGNGRPLVENVYSWDLATRINPSTGFKDVLWVNGDSVDITNHITGGQIKGSLEVRDVEIPKYFNALDSLAGNIITELNTLHANGFGLDGSSANDFFNGTTAYDIRVNPSISADLNKIAAASVLTGIPGDNTNAIAILNLQHGLIMSGGTTTFDDYYNSLVSNIGSDVQEAERTFDHQDEIVTYLVNTRETISGVSLDEEMINLIKFQNAYDSAAKLISVVDELLTTVLNMV